MLKKKKKSVDANQYLRFRGLSLLATDYLLIPFIPSIIHSFNKFYWLLLSAVLLDTEEIEKREQSKTVSSKTPASSRGIDPQKRDYKIMWKCGDREL